ncbi:TPA: hypothetical protein JAJ60_002211 [Corynebacterium striatum]|nr:hypothetical protein [Corynebacterium striatum]HAT1199731.1 hypothetical protein [Corynebacterium striatum]HAT1213333.1 hypothetical protein [Corynebacterium striatum]HAT1282099.1 hypothetical protein [Corynebacterium striatum]HAT1341303.1 hypothetical protein [Corynebacterium striatum]
MTKLESFELLRSTSNDDFEESKTERVELGAEYSPNQSLSSKQQYREFLQSRAEDLKRFPYALDQKWGAREIFQDPGALLFDDLLRSRKKGLYLTPRATDAGIAGVLANVLENHYRYDVDSGGEYSFNGTIWIQDPGAGRRFAQMLLFPQQSRDGSETPPIVRPIKELSSQKKADEALEIALRQSLLSHRDGAYVWQGTNVAAMFFEYSDRGQSSGVVDAVVKALQQNDLIRTRSSQWDVDDGIVPLKTIYVDLDSENLDLLKPDPRLLKTFGLAADPAKDGWRNSDFGKAIAKVLPNQAEATAFQRAMALAMRGHQGVRKNIYLLYGEGRNGKSGIVNAIGHGLGDYYATLSEKVLQPGNTSQHPTHMLKLQKPVCSSNEPDSSKPWDTAKAKELSGGTPIDARGMYEDARDVVPRATIFVQSNYYPQLNGSDPAFFDRIKIFHFTSTFVDDPSEIKDDTYFLADPMLDYKLKDDLGSVVAWLLEGWADYRQRGSLDLPESVISLSRVARANASPFTEFAHHYFTLDPESEGIPSDVCFQMWVLAKTRSTTSPHVKPNSANKMGELAKELGVPYHTAQNGKDSSRVMGIVPSSSGIDLLRELADPHQPGNLHRGTKEWIRQFVSKQPKC